MITSEFPFMNYGPTDKVDVTTMETDLNADKTVFKIMY
jgi:hypothetical protein